MFTKKEKKSKIKRQRSDICGEAILVKQQDQHLALQPQADKRTAGEARMVGERVAQWEGDGGGGVKKVK